jgi:pyruvate-formate lyase-activating enzyme
LIGQPSGQVEDVPGLSGVGRSGVVHRVPSNLELVPLPKEAQLQVLPGRRALGFDKKGRQVVLDGTAVAARLPIGYTRTLMPAFAKDAGKVEHLPFFGYTAVFARGDDLVCAAVRTEAKEQWSPDSYHTDDLDQRIEALQAQYPENLILRQLEICAKEYGCYNAQNIFYNRWEGAVTVSPSCNAQCRGCISLQPDDLPPSPQERFGFKPTLDEIVELGRHHLLSPDAIFSFGQGCEGEPLLQGDLIADAVRKLSTIEGRGTIHLNSNASLPDKVQKIVEAGLDSLRVSLNSVLPRVYEAYYQPKRYKFEAVKESTLLARRAGVHVSLNLLMVPGWIDAKEEVDALVRFVNECDVNMIQLRTLNIDPDLYAAHVPMPEGPVLGIPELLRVLRAKCPDLLLGNHSPRVPLGEFPFRGSVTI